jgi:hypothetical protein|tara:strand:+ start:63 stop:824 length:762 start_codon:yes stop_codon:yes gene_type:complete
MKNYIFFNGMPRAGNTLFGYLVNKHKDIAVTGNSVLPDVLLQLYRIKAGENFHNFPDEQSFDNMYKKIFDNYFEHWKQNNILIRGPWGTQGNQILLDTIAPNKQKHIILYRPLHECLNSFVSLIPKERRNIEHFAAEKLSISGSLGKVVAACKYLKENKLDYIVIHYKNLIKNPEKEIKKVFKYLNLKYSKVNYTVNGQFENNGVKYNDEIFRDVGGPEIPLHKLTLGKPRKLKSKNLLPQHIIKRCKDLDVF